MKKLLALLLALLMVVGLFAGCAKQEEAPVKEETPAVEEKPADDATTEEAEAPAEEDGEKLYTPDEYYHFQMHRGDEQKSSLDTKVGQYIAEHFGIVIDYTPVVTDWWEYNAMQLAAGTYGDAVQSFQEYVDAGKFINLDDYKDLLPDFYEHFSVQIPVWRACTPDGGLYFWDTTAPREYGTPMYYDVAVRSDVLEYYGYPELVYASDWIAFMEQALIDFPTDLNGNPTTGIECFFNIGWGISAYTRNCSDKGNEYVASLDTYAFDVKNGKYVDQMMEVPEAKETLEFWNTCAQKGLLDEESFTDGSDQQVSKASVGQPIVLFYTWNDSGINKQLTEAGHPEMSYVQMPFKLDSQKDQPRLNKASIGDLNELWGLTDNCKEPERFIKLLNWCCTDEGQTILQSGFEGETYEIDENGLRVPTDLRIQMATDDALADEYGLSKLSGYHFEPLPYGNGVDANGQPFAFGLDQEFKDSVGISDRVREVYYEGLGWKNSRAWWAEELGEPVSLDMGVVALAGDSEAGKINAQMMECYERNAANIILAEDFEAAWAAFVEEYNQYDWQFVMDTINEQYQAYLNG